MAINQKQLRIVRTAVLDKSILELSKDLGVDRMKATRQERGETFPDRDYLSKFSTVYGIGFDAIEKVGELEKVIENVQKARYK
ncbi:hypothetical protein CEH05_20485 (plasmid) [Halobacillus halophilus]|uniref:hypothetical protein n=1 Tax=Halobacillus halophilus TaxID=1570 RepID=UPI0005A05984|nr:hypothetical protein [Halobacillus halophilus]ASF41571.1 hypothetical protein CEH05_20485 [Halobacillus halophilus]